MGNKRPKRKRSKQSGSQEDMGDTKAIDPTQLEHIEEIPVKGNVQDETKPSPTHDDPSLQSLSAVTDEVSRTDPSLKEVLIGGHLLKTWYYSPYPEGFLQFPRLHLCEHCFRFFNCKFQMEQHILRQCVFYNNPPGKKIYEEVGEDIERNLIVFEVDGRASATKILCQDLCLFSKLFLEDKSLSYDVLCFKFYLLYKQITRKVSSETRLHESANSSRTSHVDDAEEPFYEFVGYFSKEKQPKKSFNLSCILTLPPFQHAGYGGFLISLSYALSRQEKQVGGPEEPISELGQRSYESYWRFAVLDCLLGSGSETKADAIAAKRNRSVRYPKRTTRCTSRLQQTSETTCQRKAKVLSVKDISDRTGILKEHVYQAVVDLDILLQVGDQYILKLKPEHEKLYRRKRGMVRVCQSENLVCD